MHQALDYLSTQLVLPRIVAGSTVEPFTVTIQQRGGPCKHVLVYKMGPRGVLNESDTVWDRVRY